MSGVDFLMIKGQRIKLRQGFSSNREAFEAVLREPLAEILPPNEELFNLSNGVLTCYVILEIVSFRDISKRLNDLPDSHHTYLCQLSDGLNTIQILEYNPWGFSLESNSRVLLIPPITVHRGLFLVNQNNIVLLTS